MRIRIKKQIIVIWVIVLFIQIITNSFIRFSGEWDFKSPFYYNLFWSIHFCTLVAIFIVPFLTKKTYIALGILVAIIWFLIVTLQFNPIDTSTYPKDVKVIDTQNSFKYIIRERQNMKTLQFKTDTVWVEDKFIFRRIIKNGIQR